MTNTFESLLVHLRDEKKFPENVLFGHADGNKIGGLGDYLFDTPHGQWSNSGQVPPGHSGRLPEMMGAMVAAGHHWVDILTMDPPTGEFLDRIARGIQTQYIDGRRATIRILVGHSYGASTIDPVDILTKLNEMLRPYQRPEIYLGQIRPHDRSWSHAKLIAVDGKMIMTGGHNLWDKDYLRDNPVFDISMRYDGPIAMGGHRFANHLWDFVRANNDFKTHTYSRSLVPSKPDVIGHEAPPSWQPSAPVRVGEVPAIWTCNPGWEVFKDEAKGSSGLAAFNFLVGRERSTARHVRIAQQDIGIRWRLVPGPWFEPFREARFPFDMICCDNAYFNLDLVNSLAHFIARSPENQLDIVVTSPDGGQDYNNKVELRAIYNIIGQRIAHHYGWGKEAIRERFQNRFRLMKVASGARDLWPPPKEWPKRCHHKFWMVDDIFYVGSENFYPSLSLAGEMTGSLQEFGIVAKADGATQKMVLEEFYQPMHKNGLWELARTDRFTWKGD